MGISRDRRDEGLVLPRSEETIADDPLIAHMMLFMSKTEEPVVTQGAKHTTQGKPAVTQGKAAVKKNVINLRSPFRNYVSFEILEKIWCVSLKTQIQIGGHTNKTQKQKKEENQESVRNYTGNRLANDICTDILS